MTISDYIRKLQEIAQEWGDGVMLFDLNQNSIITGIETEIIGGGLVAIRNITYGNFNDDDEFIWEGHVVKRYGKVSKGSKVLFSKNGELFVDTCTGAAEGLPYIFENHTVPGIGGVEVEGIIQ
jgi:hypothetical protein